MDLLGELETHLIDADDDVAQRRWRDHYAARSVRAHFERHGGKRKVAIILARYSSMRTAVRMQSENIFVAEWRVGQIEDIAARSSVAYAPRVAWIRELADEPGPARHRE